MPCIVFHLYATVAGSILDVLAWTLYLLIAFYTKLCIIKFVGLLEEASSMEGGE